jgi:hypothetical protein
LNNNIVSTKNTNAIFLAIVLVFGTITTILPSVQAETYYEMDSSYDSYQSGQKYTNNNSYESQYGMGSYEKPSYGNDKYEPREYSPKYSEREYNNYPPKYEMDSYQKSYKNNYYEQPREYPSYKEEYPKYSKDNNGHESKKVDSKSVSINKIKCINNNVNINGHNAGNVSIGNNGQGYLGGYSSANGYDNKKDKSVDCIINNNNINNNVAGGGNQTTTKATLNVTKLVTCEDTTVNGPAPVNRCAALEQLITEDQFLIEVTDDNPVPSQFTGSEAGTVVTLGPGGYTVTETSAASVNQDIATLLQQFNMQSGGIFFIQRAQSLTGDCTQVLLGGQATGTIGAGESQTCNIENSFTIGRQMA